MPSLEWLPGLPEPWTGLPSPTCSLRPAPVGLGLELAAFGSKHEGSRVPLLVRIWWHAQVPGSGRVLYFSLPPCSCPRWVTCRKRTWAWTFLDTWPGTWRGLCVLSGRKPRRLHSSWRVAQRNVCVSCFTLDSGSPRCWAAVGIAQQGAGAGKQAQTPGLTLSLQSRRASGLDGPGGPLISLAGVHLEKYMDPQAGAPTLA